MVDFAKLGFTEDINKDTKSKESWVSLSALFIFSIIQTCVY